LGPGFTFSMSTAPATQAFNPTIDQGKIAKELLADPEGARSEWDAEFRSDLTALFDDAVIADAVDHARPLELPPRPNLKYQAFTDSSAGRHDSFTFCVGHLEGPKGEETFVGDVVRGRAAPFEPRSVAWEYAALARQYHCTKIVGDNYSGEWVANAFKDAGARYETCKVTKSVLYLEALPTFNRGGVRLPDLPVLSRELRTLERRVQRSGRDSVDHPRHGSDDFANAVCGALYLALHEARKPSLRVGYSTLGLYAHQLEGYPYFREPTRVRFVNVNEAGQEITPEQAAAIRRRI
jgi:hypothetical protein